MCYKHFVVDTGSAVRCIRVPGAAISLYHTEESGWTITFASFRLEDGAVHEPDITKIFNSYDILDITSELKCLTELDIGSADMLLRDIRERWVEDEVPTEGS